MILNISRIIDRFFRDFPQTIEGITQMSAGAALFLVKPIDVNGVAQPVQIFDGATQAFRQATAADFAVQTEYLVNSAITPGNGVAVLTKVSAGAYTLVGPTTAQEGSILTISSATAFAHTVTYTAGFNGGSTASDVATFGGAIGDQFTIRAQKGIWVVQTKTNVTIA